jgi:hypothetical protein
LKKTLIYLEIIEKSLDIFEKASHHFKKASILFKMSSKSLDPLKNLSFLIEASIFLKMSTKSLLIFIKASHFNQKPPIIKMPHITGIILHLSFNVLKKYYQEYSGTN